MNHFYVSVGIFLLFSSCSFIMLTTKVKWWKKLFVVCALVISGMLSYRMLNAVYGYPSLLQNDFDDVLIVGYFPDKPNKTIYIWLKEPDKKEPISYKMPYSFKLHKKLEESRQRHKGKPYRSKVKSKNFPLEKFDETVDDVDIEPLSMYPPKRLQP